MKMLRWYPLLLGGLAMGFCGDIVSAINGQYSSSFSLSSIPLRDALLGILVGALTIIWRADRSRQRTGLTLVGVLLYSLLSTIGNHVLLFFFQESVRSMMVGDVLETSAIALLTCLLLDQVWRWYLKEECQWGLEMFFRGTPTIQPYPSLDTLTRLLSFSLIFLSFLGIVASGIPPALFAPRARNVTITLVPNMISSGATLTLTLPVHVLSQNETQMIDSVSDEIHPNDSPGTHQIITMRQEVQDALQSQETHDDLGVVDASSHCHTRIHQGVVTIQCQELVYDRAAVRRAAVNWLKHTSLPTGMSGYQEIGPLRSVVATAQLRADGDAHINMDVWSTWAYAFSPARLQQRASQLAGMGEDEAYAFLSSRTHKELDKAWLSTVGQSLPTDPLHIHFQILLQR